MIKKGQKIICSTENGKSVVEIKPHEDVDLDNIVIVNSLKSKKYQDVWFAKKDLEDWISKFKKEGYTEIKIVEDVETSKKNKKKKNG